ncbi:hypothetical protein ACFQ9H_19595 [Streptomyces sp. NPDC056517]|uniref:hypothetical protein n=1 Tax=Streptomyces sp. NPDC056517 TaxID=3345848 RepID=UPI0036CEAA14
MRAAAALLADQLSSAVHEQAVHAGRSTPAVRGAEWRLATVQTVGTDGTVTTTDGIIVRRLDSYVDVKAGDQIVVTVSGIGGWVCWGRLSTGTDGWTLLTAGTGWTTAVSPDVPPAARKLPNGTVQFRGLLRMTTATPAATALTLPAALTPSTPRNLLTVTSYGIAYLQVLASGAITHSARSGSLAANAWVALDNLEFTL